MILRRFAPLALLPAAALFLLAAACFPSREEVRQVEDTSGFVFTGNLDHALLSVQEDGRPVWKEIAIRSDERYLIPPGTYEVVVQREGKVVVRRKLFLSAGDFTEVRVP